MTEQNRVVELFMQLVRIDSETRHERQICDELQRRFAELGVRVREDDTAAVTGHGSGNLIAVLDATPGLEHVPTLLFTCHMDTVTPGKGIRPQIDADGYIRSDGTTILGSDDKAGVAALLEGIRLLGERQVAHGKLLFVITAGEESGLIGARALAEAAPADVKADFGFALDSTGQVGEIAVAAPTQARIQITITGRSAHAGVNPEDGVSAIQVASKAISRMPLGRIDFETTANIGSFAGGGATNIVCERVDIAAEARSREQSKLERQLAAMEQACVSAADEMGAKVEFISETIYPAYKFDEHSEVVQLAGRAIASIGRQLSLFHTGGGSDANMFNGMGIPTINLAVGYEHIHTVKEQMPISELVALSELVVAVVQEAAQSAK